LPCAKSAAERRKRVDRDTRRRLVGLLHELPIRVDIDSAAMAWTDTASLAERHQLTLYGASYLEVAHRLALPLGTLDSALRKAADSIRVPLLGTEA